MGQIAYLKSWQDVVRLQLLPVAYFTRRLCLENCRSRHVMVWVNGQS